MTNVFKATALTYSVLMGALLAASAPAAPPQFAGVKRDLPLPGTQRVVAVGDFNGDGQVDFAEVSGSTSVLVIALGSGSHTYTFTELPIFSSVGGVSAVDLNGDGKLDLVVAGNSIQAFLGYGDGTFSAPINLSVGNYAASQTVADFNGDGKPDLAIGISTGVQFFWGNGDGSFHAGTLLAGDNSPMVAAADFNGDGKPDLVVAGSHLFVYLGLGAGTFQQHTSAAPAGTVFELAVADFNNDGIPDIACVFYQEEGSGAQVFLGGSDGSLSSTTTLTAANSSAFTGVTAGDFDGDGKVDLAVLLWIGPAVNSGELNAVGIYQGVGDGTFSGIATTPVGNRPTGAVSVDLNGDGKLDLIVSNYPLTAGAIYGISILHGLGNRSFLQAPEIPTEPNAGTSAVATGDFNGDGLPDVITANALTADVSVLLNQGAGLRAAINSPAGMNPTFLLVGDVNGDGILDAVVAGSRSPNASILLGNGDGTFLAPLTVPLGVPKFPAQIAMADFNGDGKLDLVAVGNGTGYVYVSFGLGGGAFAAPVALSENNYSASFVVTGDVNGDGFPDILTYQADGFVFEFLSKGNGTFSPAKQLFGDDILPANVSLVDVNGDGKLDLVFVTDPAAVSLGNGDGTFGPLIQSVAAVFAGHAWAFADFNGDGKLDMAVACELSNSVVLLSGNGDGMFAIAGSYAARLGPDGVAALDLNGDGKPDVVSSNASGLSVLMNVTQ